VPRRRSGRRLPADPAPLFRLLREIYVGGKSGHSTSRVATERRLLRVLKGRIVDGSSDVEASGLGTCSCVTGC